ncbi:benzoate/H(+) symporter BenE family transporter [Vibrio sp. 188UL20-2]|uniref:Benzoate/H(+) symporter BenE family transporter n=1 Tax=Vibrio ulleungensis TaxID=2807619 RepID=A0ABS2HLD7_9VIBR|nr:benzoate/H(+) symporter BenE family transporter [Vibrio ulleungensis]
MNKLFNVSHITAGFTAVLVGYTSSVVIVIQAATTLGATPSQIESWLLALGVVMGITSMTFSWFLKTPILTAWSTPGAAILASGSYFYDLQSIIGAFMVSGLLIVLTGLIKPLNNLIKAVPASLASAMLAAIVLPICLAAFGTLSSTPVLFVVMFLAYIITKKLAPRYTMLVVLVVGVLATLISSQEALLPSTFDMAQPDWIAPQWNIAAIINIALPLYLVTMLSQNLPGIAMLKSHNYDVPVSSILLGTGLFNLLFAPLGAFSVNLAAISAAICMNKDVDSDRTQRYRAAMWAGVFYLLAGVFATSVVALFLSLPSEVSKILAGFALLGTLLMCLQSAFSIEGNQESALITFLVTLSGITLLGISSTLWGLVFGFVYWRVMRIREQHPQTKP